MKALTIKQIKNKAASYRKESVELLSELIKAGAREGGTSGKEGDRAKIVKKELNKITDKVFTDDFGNVVGSIGCVKECKTTIWFIGHIDTVAPGDWSEAYKPKLVGNKLYGRGSSDQLAGVVSSIMAIKGLKEQNNFLVKNKIRVIVMGNPHEEDIEGESLKYLLKNVIDKKSNYPNWLKGLPDIILTTEPTSDENGIPRPYFGHRGRYLYELKIKGKTGHASIPVQVPAAEVFSRTVSAIFKDVKGSKSMKFGLDTFAFTTGKLTSPSFNAHTEVITWNIDFRIAPTSKPEIIHKLMMKVAKKIRQKIATEKNIQISKIPQLTISIVNEKLVTYSGYNGLSPQELPGPWLPLKHPLRKQVLSVYHELFNMDPPYDKKNLDLKKSLMHDKIEGDLTIRDFYNFSTDLTGLAQLIRKSRKEGKKIPKIAYLGLGSGIEEQAHCKNEWCPISSLDNATSFYMALILSLA